MDTFLPWTHDNGRGCGHNDTAPCGKPCELCPMRLRRYLNRSCANGSWPKRPCCQCKGTREEAMFGDRGRRKWCHSWCEAPWSSAQSIYPRQLESVSLVKLEMSPQSELSASSLGHLNIFTILNSDFRLLLLYRGFFSWTSKKKEKSEEVFYVLIWKGLQDIILSEKTKNRMIYTTMCV